MAEPADHEYVMSEWRLVSPTRDSTLRTLKGFLFSAFAMLLMAFLPNLLTEIRLLLVTLAIGSIIGAIFEWIRLRRGHRAYEAFRFDHRRIEQLMRENDDTPGVMEVLAFDGIEYVNVAKDDIYLQPLGSGDPMLIELLSVGNRDFAESLIAVLKSKGISIHFLEDSDAQ